MPRHVDGDDPDPDYFVATGTLTEIATEELRRKQEHGQLSPLVLINIGDMLRRVHARARHNDIKLPFKFTAKPGTPEHAAMWAEIEAYQERSQERLRGKGRRRVPVPRAVKMSEVDA
jgi:hypothetical protein